MQDSFATTTKCVPTGAGAPPEPAATPTGASSTQGMVERSMSQTGSVESRHASPTATTVEYLSDHAHCIDLTFALMPKPGDKPLNKVEMPVF